MHFFIATFFFFGGLAGEPISSAKEFRSMCYFKSSPQADKFLDLGGLARQAPAEKEKRCFIEGSYENSTNYKISVFASTEFTKNTYFGSILTHFRSGKHFPGKIQKNRLYRTIHRIFLHFMVYSDLHQAKNWTRKTRKFCVWP